MLSHSKYKGFYIIKQFPQYAINLSGVILKIACGTEMVWQLEKGYGGRTGGYRRTRLVDIHGVRRSVSRHRQLCLAFKRLPKDPELYTVNHKNGVPGNDWLDNLEWTTYSENTKHAYSNGLILRNVRPVEVFFPDGTTCEFASRIEAIEVSGVKETTVDKRLSVTPGRVMSDGYGFRYTDLKEPWHCQAVSLYKAKKVYLKDHKCGKIYRFSSCIDAADFLNVCENIIYAVVKRQFCMIKHFEVKFDDRPWSNYSKLQLKYLEKHWLNKNKPSIIIASRDAEKKIFIDSNEASEFFNRNSKYVRQIARVGGNLNNWKLSLLEFKDLK